MAEHEEELARVRAGLAAQSAVARVLADAPTLAEATPRLLAAIGPTLGWEVGALWSVDARDGLLRCQATWRASPGDDEFERLSLQQAYVEGEGLPGRVWTSGRPQWIADVLSEGNFPRWKGAAREGLRSWFGFPIHDRDRILGVIEFFTREVRSPDEEILGLTAMFGDQIGQYVRRRQAEDATRASETRQAAILESALDAIITIDAQGHVLAFNPAAERMFGRRHDEAVGRELAELIVPPSLRAAHRGALERIVATGEARLLGQRLELTGMRAGGDEFPVELTLARVELDGAPAFTGYVRDTTERKRAELRAQILAETGEDLTASLDLETTLSAVAGLSVPRVADWCVVDLVEAGRRRIERVAVAHADPSKEALAWELERRFRTDLNAPEGVPKAVRTGRSELMPEISDDLLTTVARDEHHLALLRSLGLRSAMIVPLRARGETLGAISFVAAESGRRFDEDDLAFAEELARRAALAIANARTHAERSRIAETLQASLIPPRLPMVPGLTVASRFRAAGEAYDVGGDFFDLFAVGPSDWMIVMGDVSGKGPEAAAVTALARYTVREAAVHDARPSGVLARLNEAILSRQAEGGDRFCTALVGRLRPGGSGAHLALASGGHPLPLRLDAGGQVEPVGTPGLLLGFDRDLEPEDVEIELQGGDSLLLYTDGVTETPTAAGLLGEDGLATLLERCADLDADALVERVDRTVVDLQAGAPRDDIAMVALQVVRGSSDEEASPGREGRLATVSLSRAWHPAGA
ncbi:MAG: SpoIIE family protein phosphatase [Thermoleophilaceae bacterium]|nr:SpoIIE family protein phosphatase [Thermoleophilaceae bacterium]